jgi:hypothetical protein
MILVPNSDWHKRLWTVQEASLASRATMHLGSFSCNWVSFCGLLLRQSNLSVHTSLGMELDPMIYDVYRLRLRTRMICQAKKLLPLQNEAFGKEMHLLRHLEAIDPKDKAFALYGVLKIMQIDLPPPDYSKDVAEIYCDTLLAIWTSGRQLNFRHYSNPNNNPHHLPSWVTDWSEVDAPQYTRQNLNQSFYEPPEPSKASGNSAWEVKPLTLGSNGLLVKGYVIDTITELGMVFPICTGIEDTDALLLPQENISKIFQSWLKLGSYADLAEAMFRGALDKIMKIARLRYLASRNGLTIQRDKTEFKSQNMFQNGSQILCQLGTIKE